MFKPVNSKTSLPQIEESILNFWRENKTFQRSVTAREQNPRFVLYEGPPTANGNPGIHHVLARAFKDVIPRYKAMKGYYTPRQAGWDSHGLPVELEVERDLGLSSKEQIEEYGIDQFNNRCRESVFRYLKEWEAMTERIGFWIDLEHPYVTMENSYIETVWWAIKQMWDKGLVYQGYRVTPHCPRCGTSLSSHEVSLGYQDNIEDPSVYIKFKVVLPSSQDSEIHDSLYKLTSSSGKPIYLLAWTTTPWTLPGNTSLAISANADYTLLEGDTDYLIVAERLFGANILEGYKVVDTFRGRILVDLRYEPLFNPHDFGMERQRFQNNSELQLQEAEAKLTYRVIASDFVSMEDGTGIVHIAPAYGEVDFQAGEDNNLDFVHNVDLQGKVIGNYPFAGRFVKEADPLVLEDLERRGLLYHSEKIRHTYPFCWRCGTPLLYYAKQTWYIRTTAIKNRLIAGNNEINWYPEHIKYGRFGDWLENNVDWAFSRERYWGTPLPVWHCTSCNNYDCIGSLKELTQKDGFNGFKKPLDLHRPFIDKITYTCPQCGAGMQRVLEVIDCWFDSGAMPIAQLHYPFDNKGLFDKELKQADYICEAIDQTRGWFYSLHAISTLLFDRPCFRNVICLGHILDTKGEKMSKARGNVVQPWLIINKYGADALRWYFYTASSPGNVRRFDEKMVSEIARRFLLTLWNVYSFFVTYANIDQFTPGSRKSLPDLPELDRWIISELNQLIVDVDKALDGYNPTDAGRKLENFVDELSNWYVRRSRRRFWKSENDADKLAAYLTLYQCLVILSKLLAPLAPFLAEELYQNLVRSTSPDEPDSVHLTDFPVADTNHIDEQLVADTRLVMKVASLGRAARSQAGIKIRQPLDRVVVSVASSQEQSSLERLKHQILDELNVKEMQFADDISQLDTENYVIDSDGSLSLAVPIEISPELAAEGMAREIIHRLQTMRRVAGFNISDYITIYYQGNAYMKTVMETYTSHIKQETLSCKLVEGIPEEGVFTEDYKLGGYEILLGVKRLT
ncbi:isoleucine--tRNA ligase [Chloroflexota bacterium]